MKKDKGGDAGKGDAQQTDKLQEDKLRKLQAGQRLRQILMGDSFSEGEGSSQGSETESEQEEGAQRMEMRQVKVFYQQRFSQRQRKKGKRNSGKCEGVLMMDGVLVEASDSSGRVLDRKQLTEREVVNMEYMEKGDGIEVGSVQVTLRESWCMEGESSSLESEPGSDQEDEVTAGSASGGMGDAKGDGREVGEGTRIKVSYQRRYGAKCDRHRAKR